MLPERRIFSECLRIADVLVMLCALGLALLATQPNVTAPTFVEFLKMKIGLINIVVLAFLCMLWPLLLEEGGLLQPWSHRSLREEALAVAKVVSLGALVLLLLVVVFHRGNVTPQTIVVFWLIALAGTLGAHLVFRGLARNLRQASSRQVLIVGSGPRAQRLARGLEQQKDVAGYRLLGFVDDEISPEGANGTKLVATIADLPSFLHDHVVDEVIITLPMRSKYQSILDVSQICEEQGIPVRIPSDLFQLRMSNRSISDLGGEQVLTFYTGAPPRPWSRAVKRVLDIVGSAVLILVFAPIFLAAAVAIKLNSSGPVLFRQERLGINKRRFQIFKFRTMVVDAEQRMKEVEHLNEVDGAAFKLRDDPRVTSVGRVLRKFSIDELPQLMNVFTGEMSLVGPRPLPVRDVMGIKEAWQKRRFSVKPGITCLWQVNGRSNVKFQEWMKMDLEYIDTWSLGLDLKILVKTIPAVVRGEGAT